MSSAAPAIWNKYWIATLSASPLLSNAPYIAAQMKDLADKLESAEGGLANFGRGVGGAGAGGGAYLMGGERSKKDDSQLKKIVRDSSKITREHLQVAANVPPACARATCRARALHAARASPNDS